MIESSLSKNLNNINTSSLLSQNFSGKPRQNRLSSFPLKTNSSSLLALASYNKAFIKINSLAKPSVSFKALGDGYPFFLKSAEVIHCAYSGERVYTLKNIKAFAQELALAKGQEVVTILSSLRKDLKPLKTDEFVEYLKVRAIEYPEATFEDLFQRLGQEHESNLRAKQLIVYDAISEKALDLPEHVWEKVETVLEKARSGELVKRNTIIREIYNSGEVITDREERRRFDRMMQAAGTLPKSYKDLDAFLVKYWKYRQKDGNLNELVNQIVFPHIATVEHVFPHKLGDKEGFSTAEIDSANNYIVTCSSCNNNRGDEDFATFIDENQARKVHLLNYIREIIEIVRQPEFIEYKDHPIIIVDTINRAYGKPLLEWNGHGMPKLLPQILHGDSRWEALESHALAPSK